MSDARQAIAAAVEAGAETYAADELAQAKSMLDRAETALRDGAYDESRADALLARDYAIDAQATALATSGQSE